MKQEDIIIYLFLNWQTYVGKIYTFIAVANNLLLKWFKFNMSSLIKTSSGLVCKCK